MKTLKIKWQRLVDERGQTCKRCGSTESELQKALQILEKSLAPLGIKVTIEKTALAPKIFTDDPSESNRIWISGRPLEEWLDAQVSQSPCCDICGDAECRTVEVERKTYETIPSDLIVRAGLVAASQLLGSCCPK